jgi:hypothetical protein
VTALAALRSVAQVPALPLHEAGKYVAAAYITLLVLVLVYVAVMALRVGRIERDLAALSQGARDRSEIGQQQPPRAPQSQHSRSAPRSQTSSQTPPESAHA